MQILPAPQEPGIPAQAQAALAAAEEQQRQIDLANFAAQNPEVGDTAPADPAATTTAQSAEIADTKSAAPTTTAKPDASAELDRAVQEAKTWRGRAEAEARRAQEALAVSEMARNEATARADELARKLNDIDSPTHKAAAEAATKDASDFGAEMLDMVKRQASYVAKMLLEEQLAPMKAQLAQLTNGVAGVGKAVSVTAEQQFYSQLTQQVPDYKSINADNAFLAWLASSDEVYGITRQSVLDQAAGALDADRVASIFLAFKRQGQLQPVPATMSALAAQVTPARSGVTTTPAANAAPGWVSQAEIVKFYDQQSRGLYQGTPEQVAALEAAYNKAIAEGRVR